MLSWIIYSNLIIFSYKVQELIVIKLNIIYFVAKYRYGLQGISLGKLCQRLDHPSK